MTREVAKHDANVLKSFTYNLNQAIAAQTNSPISYSSEFQLWHRLEPLLHRHPLWYHMKAYLKNGVAFPLVPISETVRSIDKKFMLTRGNHKSVLKSKECIRELINKDVTQCHALPLTLECLTYLHNISIAPIRVVEKETIDKHENDFLLSY